MVCCPNICQLPYLGLFCVMLSLKTYELWPCMPLETSIRFTNPAFLQFDGFRDRTWLGKVSYWPKKCLQNPHWSKWNSWRIKSFLLVNYAENISYWSTDPSCLVARCLLVKRPNGLVARFLLVKRPNCLVARLILVKRNQLTYSKIPIGQKRA